MSGYHVVKQGECLSSIAKLYGFTNYITIYNDSANETFRRERPDPHVIYPGDMIFIPELQLRTENRNTDQKHSFRVKRPHTILRLKLLDENARPLTNAAYRLLLEGELYTGNTGPEGIVEQPLFCELTTGFLAVDVEKTNGIRRHRWTLKIGSLDPVEETTGVQARLNNLGWFCGDVDAVLGPATEAAIRRFQEASGELKVDGIAGPKVRAKLKSMHGC